MDIQSSIFFYLFFAGRSYPFRLGFVTDNNEVCAGVLTQLTCEADLHTSPGTGGIIGFALGFEQKSC